jgi:ABC-type branched-subunit amino acid transport system ATPase component
VRSRLERITQGAPVFPLLVLFGLNAVDELDRTAFAILTPNIRDHFGLENQGILSIISLVVLLALIGSIVIGYYADRVRRVRLALGGAALWGVFTLFTGLATGVLMLVAARSLTALGRAVNDPTHNSLLADYYPPAARVQVYGFHRVANSVGQIVGPLVGGGLAYLYGWRTPFLIFWLPTLVLVGIALTRLRDPIRGEQERRAAGGSEEDVATEEAPPSWGEAWRACAQVRTLRRIWWSLPFLAVAFAGVASVFSIVYADVFGLNEFQRGVVQAFAEPFQLVGIALVIPIAAKLAARSHTLLFRLLLVVTAVVTAGVVGFALAPNVGIAIAMHILVTATLIPTIPVVYSVLSLVLPPRARSFGFSIGGLFVVPGLLVLPLVGWAADNIGVRAGVLFLTPVFLIGGLIIASAGRFVEEDIERVRSSALAQARTTLARRTGTGALLVCTDVDVSYGQTQVLFGVDFHVDEGEIVALLGTNGAGKSTLLNAISGLVEPHGGAIVLEGRDITTMPANETAKLGIVMVPGGKGVFPTLTVRENLELAGWLYQKDKAYLDDAIEQVLGYFPRLRERWEQKAGNLSGGEQQMLTLGQAFIAKPKLLMIDELSLGLAPVIVEMLLDIVKEIHQRGTTVVLVEQSVNVAIKLAQRAVFMEKGEVRFDGPTDELLDRPDILRAVFLQGTASVIGGSEHAGDGAPVRARERKPFVEVCEDCGTEHRPILEVRGLTVAFGGIRAVDDVDLSVREGEIFGLIGPNGAGKTTIFDLVSGFLTPQLGRIRVGGEDVTELPPDERAMRGLGRSFQDARLFPSMTVAENLAVALERHIPTKDPVAAAMAAPATRAAERWVDERVEELVDIVHLGAFANKFVSELSTGSRRVVDLACSLAHEPRVLLLDEPSSGIAQKETEALGPLLLEIRERTGAALLVIEHDMPLITSISDEMVALDLGRVIAHGTPEDVVRDPAVVASYLGTDETVIQGSGEARRPAEASGNGTNAKGSRARRRSEPLVAAARGARRNGAKS